MNLNMIFKQDNRGSRGFGGGGGGGGVRGRMVVGFTNTYAISALPITTNVVSSSLIHGKVCSIQHYVIKFVSDLRLASGFLRVLRIPPPIKRYN